MINYERLISKRLSMVNDNYEDKVIEDYGFKRHTINGDDYISFAFLTEAEDGENYDVNTIVLEELTSDVMFSENNNVNLIVNEPQYVNDLSIARQGYVYSVLDDAINSIMTDYGS